MKTIKSIDYEPHLSNQIEGTDVLYINPASYEVNENIYSFDDYLPVLYKNGSESEYLKTLFKALETSYSNALYQFEYIQPHMIFMVCIYYMLLKVNAIFPQDIENALFYMIKDKNRVGDFYGPSNTRGGDLYFGSFAVLGESDVFLLLKIVGIDPDLQGELKKLVEERNKYAHANGNITITSQKTIDDKILQYLKTLERVQKLVQPIIIELYIKTLKDPDSSDPEERLGYLDDDEQVKEELIKKYSLSYQDINVCRKFNINDLGEEQDFKYIKALHIALCNYYKELRDDDTLDCTVSASV